MGKEWQSKLEIGDLLVDTASKNSGILVQKHRVLSTSGNFVNDRWYWAGELCGIVHKATIHGQIATKVQLQKQKY